MQSALFITVPPRRPSAGTLLALIHELGQVLAEENARLAAGLPASEAGTVGRKEQLSDRLTAQWRAYAADRPAMAADQDGAYPLIGAIARLRAAAEENAALLETSLAASRQRIERVMAARE